MISVLIQIYQLEILYPLFKSTWLTVFELSPLALNYQIVLVVPPLMVTDTLKLQWRKPHGGLGEQFPPVKHLAPQLAPQLRVKSWKNGHFPVQNWSKPMTFWRSGPLPPWKMSCPPFVPLWEKAGYATVKLWHEVWLSVITLLSTSACVSTSYKTVSDKFCSLLKTEGSLHTNAENGKLESLIKTYLVLTNCLRI